MGKNSARSKGYRKYKKEVKGYTEQEKKTIIIGFAVILVIVICAIVIPNAIEAKDLLRVKNGVVQNVGDNWLVSDMSETSKHKYRKIAEVDPAEGWQLRERADGISDANEAYFYFEPIDAENAVADEYYAIVGKGTYDELGAKAVTSMSGFANEVLYQADLVTEEYEGRNISYYVLEYTLNVSEDENNPEYQYCQNISMYIESPIAERCVLLNASNTGTSEEDFGDRDAIIAMLKEATTHVTLEN